MSSQPPFWPGKLIIWADFRSFWSRNDYWHNRWMITSNWRLKLTSIGQSSWNKALYTHYQENILMSIAKRTENNCEFMLAKSWRAKMNHQKRSETELWEVDANPGSSKWLNGPQALKYDMKISPILDRQNFGYGFSLRKSPNIDVDKYQFNFWVSFFFQPIPGVS